MRKTFLALPLLAAPASAHACPDFYRFVDFGQVAPDGQTYRGGPTFRAEGFDGAPLILDEHTDCRDLRDTARDGHGNPIPVVTRIRYDPARVDADLAEIGLRVVEDTTRAAEENAAAHRARLEEGTEIARGPDFLCAATGDAASCQIVPPHPGTAPLVIHCDAETCAMPAMALDSRILVFATWPRPSDAALGPDTVDKARRIHAFLDPLSS